LPRQVTSLDELPLYTLPHVTVVSAVYWLHS